MLLGCQTRFHRPVKQCWKADYDLLVPSRYLVIKDDIFGLPLNT